MYENEACPVRETHIRPSADGPAPQRRSLQAMGGVLAQLRNEPIGTGGFLEVPEGS